MPAEQVLIARARSGEASAFADLVGGYQAELRVHCYRILGSLQDAEDMTQETLLAAWRGLDRFEGRASVRAWLYRIATNGCLNMLRARGRRPQQVRSATGLPRPTRISEPVWLEPYPDVLLEGLADTAPGPQARYELRESVALAFIAALQHLPPRQRAVLVLRDVLGFRTAEVAGMLELTEPSVKGALRRARATVGGHRDQAASPATRRERDLADRFAVAVEHGDTGAVISLLTDQAWLTMPPEPYEYQGRAAIAGFLNQRAGLLGATLKLVATRANGQPAFGCYLPDAHAAVLRSYGLMVLGLESERIGALTWFGDRGLFAYFGLPRTLTAAE